MGAAIELLNSWGGRFVQFTWPMLVQSSVVMVVLLGLNWALERRVRAVVRYALLLLVLVKLVLPPSLAVPTGVGYWVGPAIKPTEAAEIAPPANLPPKEDPSPGLANAAPMEVNVEPSVARTEAPMSAASTDNGKANLTSVAPSAALSWQAMCLLSWCVGIVLLAVYVLRRSLQVFRLTAQAEDAPAHLLAILQACREQLRIRRNIRLKLSGYPASPAVCGVFRPVILVPKVVAEALSALQLRAVLLHELGHIKRGDLWVNHLQTLLQILYWYNPLLWVANAVIRRVREQAVDELVMVTLRQEAEVYPDTLLEVAKVTILRSTLSLGLVGIAESRGGLKERIRRLLTQPIPRSAKVGLVGALMVLLVAGIVLPMAKGQLARREDSAPHELPVQIKEFAARKEQQARQMAQAYATLISQTTNELDPLLFPIGFVACPTVWAFFDAVKSSNWDKVVPLREELRRRTDQSDVSVLPIWQPALEADLAAEQFALGEPKYAFAFGREIIESIPAGSVFLGGTDAGRGIVTALCKLPEQGDPFYVLTQNQLANSLYLKYIRDMYGKRVYIPTGNDAQLVFQKYLADARRRLEHDQNNPSEAPQITPGENIRVNSNRVEVSGPVAVMTINAGLLKIMFDKNPEREFFIEQSTPMDWMYPHLSPHNLILKVNRQPLGSLSPTMVSKDFEYWQRCVREKIGDWLKPDTSVEELSRFAERVFLQKDLARFTGDPQFVRNEYACKMYSKLRSSIAVLYAWRVKHATTPEEAQRMKEAAGLAFRQALALFPANPEAVSGYAELLAADNRFTAARLIVQTAMKVAPDNPELGKLLKNLQETRGESGPITFTNAGSTATASAPVGMNKSVGESIARTASAMPDSMEQWFSNTIQSIRIQLQKPGIDDYTRKRLESELKHYVFKWAEHRDTVRLQAANPSQPLDNWYQLNITSIERRLSDPDLSETERKDLEAQRQNYIRKRAENRAEDQLWAKLTQAIMSQQPEKVRQARQELDDYLAKKRFGVLDGTNAPKGMNLEELMKRYTTNAGTTNPAPKSASPPASRPEESPPANGGTAILETNRVVAESASEDAATKREAELLAERRKDLSFAQRQRSAEAMSQEFYAEGVLKIETYAKEGTVLQEERATGFNVGVKGCNYKICRFFSGSTNRFEWYSDGDVSYRILVSPPVTGDPPGVSNLSPRPNLSKRPNKTLYPMYIDAMSKMPVDDGSYNQYLWLALASHCFFKGLATNRLPGMWMPDDPSLTREELQKEAFITMRKDALNLPAHVVYMSDGVYRGYSAARKEPLRINLPPPFDHGFTNAVYETGSWIPVANFSIPETFTFTRYATPVTANSKLWPRVILRGRVTNVVQRVPIAEFRPELSGQASIYDARGSGKGVVKPPTAKTNGGGPGANK